MLDALEDVLDFTNIFIIKGEYHKYHTHIFVCTSVVSKMMRRTVCSNRNYKSVYSKTEQKLAEATDRGFILALLCDSMLLYM